MSAVVTADHLRVAYGSTPIFDGVHLSLEASSFTALVGPNGCGKSSLLRVLAGLQRPDAGTVKRQGEVALIASSASPPPDVTPRQLADYGLALRRPWWRFGPSASDEAAAADALSRAGILDRADDPVASLSDGEVQRAWIAAALARNGAALLVDEPTSHLDIRYQLEVLRTLRALARSGVAVAAAIHDLSLAARFADRVALLAGGTLTDGPPEEMFEPTAVRAAFGVDVTIHRHPTEGYLVCLPS